MSKLKKDQPIEALAGIFTKESDEWEEIEKKLYNDRLNKSKSKKNSE